MTTKTHFAIIVYDQGYPNEYLTVKNTWECVGDRFLDGPSPRLFSSKVAAQKVVAQLREKDKKDAPDGYAAPYRIRKVKPVTMYEL